MLEVSTFFAAGLPTHQNEYKKYLYCSFIAIQLHQELGKVQTVYKVQERFSVRFFPCHVIGLVMNFDQFEGVASPSAISLFPVI